MDRLYSVGGVLPHLSVEGRIRQRYRALFEAGLEHLVGRKGASIDLGLAPTMAPRLDPWLNPVSPDLFTLGNRQWLLTVTRAVNVERRQGNGSVISVKEIADQEIDPLVMDIAADCCVGVRGVEIDGEPFAIAWGGNRVICLNLGDETLVETVLDWAVDDPVVGAVFTDEKMVVTTESGLICALNPLQPDTVWHHRLGPKALDLVQVGDTLVQICSPATLWVIDQQDEPRRLELQALKEDAERFTNRDGFAGGKILGAQEVNGKLLVELPHAYYLVDLAKGKIDSRHPTGEVRVARFDQAKMRYSYHPRSHLQLSTVSLLDERVVAMFCNSDLVVWFPSQERPWKLHLDFACNIKDLWHALTHTDGAFKCIQLCRDCGQVHLYTFNKDSSKAELEKEHWSHTNRFLDLRTGLRGELV